MANYGKLRHITKEMLLEHQGKTINEACKEIGVSPQWFGGKIAEYGIKHLFNVRKRISISEEYLLERKHLLPQQIAEEVGCQTSSVYRSIHRFGLSELFGLEPPANADIILFKKINVKCYCCGRTIKRKVNLRSKGVKFVCSICKDGVAALAPADDGGLIHGVDISGSIDELKTTDGTKDQPLECGPTRIWAEASYEQLVASGMCM